MTRYTLYIEVDKLPMDEEDTDFMYKLIDEVYLITMTGILVLNPRTLNFHDDPLPLGRTHEDRVRVDNYRVLTSEEIALVDQVGAINFCKTHNDQEITKLFQELESFQKDLTSLPGSEDVKNIISSLHNILGKFLVWYRFNKVTHSIFEQTNPINKIKWTNKYKPWLVDRVDKFSKLTLDEDTERKLLNREYDLYEFENWTFDKCYNYFRVLKNQLSYRK